MNSIYSSNYYQASNPIGPVTNEDLLNYLISINDGIAYLQQDISQMNYNLITTLTLTLLF